MLLPVEQFALKRHEAPLHIGRLRVAQVTHDADAALCCLTRHCQLGVRSPGAQDGHEH